MSFATERYDDSHTHDYQCASKFAGKDERIVVGGISAIQLLDEHRAGSAPWLILGSDAPATVEAPKL